MTFPGDLAEGLAMTNAAFNVTSFVLVALGIRAIKSGDRERHRRFMLAALTASALFLVSYLTRAGIAGHRVFAGEGTARTIYLVILGTHTPLAALVVPFILRAAWLAWRDRLAEHRRLARWVWPVWLYVSITGVIVYVMLYQMSWAVA